jgi:hypothetical protein
LGDAIRQRHIKTISQKVLDFNQAYRKGMSFIDFMDDYEQKGKGMQRKSKKRKGANGTEMMPTESDDVSIHSTKDLRNIYDEGYLNNLWDICFPHTIRP